MIELFKTLILLPGINSSQKRFSTIIYSHCKKFFFTLNSTKPKINPFPHGLKVQNKFLLKKMH